MFSTVVVAHAGPGLLAHFPDLVRLPGGSLLATYREGAGHVRSDGRIRVTTGTGDGLSWEPPRTAVDGPWDDRDPELAVLADGTVLLSWFVLDWSTEPHTGLGTFTRRSADGGRTWGDSRPTDLPASSYHALALSTGEVLITYGDLAKRFSPHRATVGRLVPDPALSWDGHPDVLLYDSGHHDQANPSSAELAPGRFLTLGFDVPAATIVGVFSEKPDYLS